MNLQEWRTDADLIKKAVKLHDSETFQAMMNVVDSERPSRNPLPRVGPSGYDHAYNYGREVGYGMVIDILRAMATRPEETEDQLVANFSDTNDYLEHGN